MSVSIKPLTIVSLRIHENNEVFIYLCIYLYLYLYLCLYLCLSITSYIYLSISIYIYLSIAIYICLSLSIYLHRSISIYLYLSIGFGGKTKAEKLKKAAMARGKSTGKFNFSLSILSILSIPSIPSIRSIPSILSIPIYSVPMIQLATFDESTVTRLSSKPESGFGYAIYLFYIFYLFLPIHLYS